MLNRDKNGFREAVAKKKKKKAKVCKNIKDEKN